MSRFRTFIFWSHLVLGLAVGTVVLIMAATGVLLSYERQITEWADTRSLDGSPPTPNAPAQTAATLLARVTETEGRTPTTLTWPSSPEEPLKASFGREGSVYVNAYTGAVLGAGSPGIHRFFSVVKGVHRWLGAQATGRNVGRAITGAANLGFLLIVISGLYLWLPRRRTKTALRQVTLFRRHLSPKARDFNWHNVIGFWGFLPLIVIVVSGVVISYPWASNLVYTLVGEEAPAQGGGGHQPATVATTPPGSAVQPADLSRADEALRQARARVAGWRTISLQVPSGALDPLNFTVDTGSGGQPQHQTHVIYDALTGEEVQVVPFSDMSNGRQARSILRFAHTGEVLGFVGQTIAALASLGACLLVWTGLSLSLRRLKSWQGRRTRVAA